MKAVLAQKSNHNPHHRRLISHKFISQLFFDFLLKIELTPPRFSTLLP